MMNVVVLMNDGRRRKGITDRFQPERPFLLLRQVDVAGNPTGYVDVEMRDIRAAFFVHDLALNRTSRHTMHDAPFQPPLPDPAKGTMVRVRFTWGEVMDGVIYDYDPDARAFFLHPHGPLNRAYNVERVYVTRDAIRELKVLATPATASNA
ncbi:MAG TPA: hypothetical protein VJP59_02055 [Gemmatimonadota bacterium]|nr:hypothetical protein [Gemmatimonadota bacterium]